MSSESKKEYPRFDKRSCYERARKILDTGDDVALRYACLELRFCIEAITYDKLRMYAKRLPSSVFENWQPHQAIKALLKLEPNAMETISVAISKYPDGEESEFVSLGTRHNLPLPWMRTVYSKLGNYLHIPTPKQQNLHPQNLNPEKLRADLKEIVERLRSVAENTFDASLANTVEFPCEKCGQEVVCNAEALRLTKKAVCLNEKCEAEFEPNEIAPGQFNFGLIMANINCVKCASVVSVERRFLESDSDYQFSCRSCDAIHKIGRGIGLVNPTETPTPGSAGGKL